MSALRVNELLHGLDARGAANDVIVESLTLDSRQARPGVGFVALRGATRHGAEFAAQALSQGAPVVLYEPPADVPGAAIAVPNLRTKLGEIANRLYGAPSHQVRVVGVTGTNGKTSTVQLLAQALSAAGHIAGSIGTLGAGLVGQLDAGERTTPDVLSVHALLARMRAQGATHIAMEVSSHALDQGRVDGVRFAVAVFTNLTHDHLDYHGSMDAYGAAKAKLFAWPELDAAVINRDDAHGRRLLDALRPGLRVLSYSARGDANADVVARNIVADASGLRFDLHTPWGAIGIASRLIGRFNVANLLAVAGTLAVLEFGLDAIARLISGLDPVRGRMNRLGGNATQPLVVVDYAHTPDALEQALINLRAHTRGRLICVFGCGGDRDRAKRPIMGALAERLADVAIVTDDNPRSEDGDAIVGEIVAGYADRARARVERNRARAIASAVQQAQPGDAVLIAGKGHETYQEVGAQKLPFDDLAHARAALEARP
jgi:UDP-N-acetylmuramoyl-L-alanyl-D-glutamate--2,6-diaminopimelate ligase